MDKLKIDEIDKHLLRFKWYVRPDGYVGRNSSRKENGGKQTTLLLHREIMQPVFPLVVDHINGDKLDNRRSNLRVVSRGDNNCNKKRSKGYCFHKLTGKYAANFRKKHLGLFDTPELAKVAYIKAQNEYWASKEATSPQPPQEP